MIILFGISTANVNASNFVFEEVEVDLYENSVPALKAVKCLAITISVIL
ncbi:hypothetical protein LQZ18_10020 [Lachnospiraceae bacterium ZAX-1]